VKAKQKTIRIFEIEIENEDDFFSYMAQNLILLKEYFLIIKGNTTPKIINYLDKNDLCFIKADECKLNLTSKTKSSDTRDTISTNNLEKSNERETITISSQSSDTIPYVKEIKTLLFEKTIRSGEEIISEGDITIFGRVNSAAKVISEGNVEIYGTIDGLVQCNGNYMIVKELGKGHIIFNGDILEREDFNGNLKKITYSSDGAVIRDIFEAINN